MRAERSAPTYPEHDKLAKIKDESHADEQAQSVVVDFLTDWRFCPVSTASNPSRSCLEDAAKQLVTVLRNLASQEHRGEVTRIAKLEALEPGWDSYDADVPTEQALERLRGFDRALAYVPLGDGGVQVEFHALGLDFEAVIDPNGQVTEYDLEPSTGEAARLRERLLRRVEEAEQALDPNHGVAVRTDTAHERLTSIRELLSAAPSDSQGGQEACSTCGGTKNDPANRGWEIRPGGRWKPCPDCDPASTQGEGQQGGSEMGRAIDALARSLGGVAVARPEWADYEEQKPRLAAAVIAVLDTVIRPPFSRLQREGGGEEDWPALRICRDGDDFKIVPLPWVEGPESRRYVPATTQEPTAHPGGAAGEGEDAVEAIHRVAIEAELDDLDQTTLAEWASLLTALGAEGWHLVHAVALPAAVPSEPSVLEKERDRLSGALVEQQGRCKGLEARLDEAAADAADVVGPVLREVAAEFERKASECTTLPKSLRGSGGWKLSGARHANEEAASLCREKAAALKETKQ